jgi:mono/diheme cytochrome c family protein
MSTLRSIVFAALFAAAAFTVSHASAATQAKADAQSIARGRYIAQLGGCNDCHTAKYMLSDGKVAQKDWLMGDILGWRGDWGTTYAPNLRITMSKLTEDQWVKTARTLEARPPMPWFTLREMKEQDLRAFYRFVRQLGSVGDPAPAYLPPGQTPNGPYVQFPSFPK